MSQYSQRELTALPQTNHRDFSNSSTYALDEQLCPQGTLGSQDYITCSLKILYLYTSDYNRLNYGKDMHNRAYC